MFGLTHRWCVAAIIWQWLARIRQSATLVFLVQARRNEFPALFDGQRMIPLHGRKLLVALESSVLTGETRWLFLGFLARTAGAHKTLRKCEEDKVICDLKAQLHCAATAAERRRCDRLLWRRRRALARQRQVGFSAGSMRGEPVLERENERVWGEHSFECYVAEWLLDSVEATGTSVGILVRTSLEPDGGFLA